MLYLCFTADYELFFGENFVSEEKVVIQPTYTLLDVLSKNNVPLTLMADVCSIARYKELNISNNYVEKTVEQLKYAIKKGHDVQLHIHSHWVTSSFDEGKWVFDYQHYRVHSLGFDKLDNKLEENKSARDIISSGKQYLVKLLKPVDSTYDCIGFRAGGWCIQPEGELLKTLANEGIIIDTTVYRGGYIRSEHHFLDFRNVPRRPNWWIDPSKGLNYEAKREKGNIFEVPIGSYSNRGLSWWKKLRHKPYRLKLKNKVEKPRGIGMDGAPRTKIGSLLYKLEQLFFQPIIFSFDAACKPVMIEILNSYLRNFDCEKNDYYISIIGHPKTLSQVDFEEIDKFCSEVNNKYDYVRFIKLRDIRF